MQLLKSVLSPYLFCYSFVFYFTARIIKCLGSYSVLCAKHTDFYKEVIALIAAIMVFLKQIHKKADGIRGLPLHLLRSFIHVFWIDLRL